jgi:SCP-2 sterol transfer family
VTDATAEFFGELGRRGHEPLLAKARGTIRVDLEQGTKTDRWLVRIDRGHLVVEPGGGARDSDAVIRADRELFDVIVDGEMNAMAAMLRGAMSVDGDLQLIVLFQRLLPGPRRSKLEPKSLVTTEPRRQP